MWSFISSRLETRFVCSCRYSIEVAKSTSTQISTSWFSSISKRELSWLWKILYLNHLKVVEHVHQTQDNKPVVHCFLPQRINHDSLEFLYKKTQNSDLHIFLPELKTQKRIGMKGSWTKHLHIYLDRLKIGKTAPNYHPLRNMGDQCHVLKNSAQVHCHLR